MNTLQIKPCDFHQSKTFVNAVLNLGVASEGKAGREKVRLGLPRLQPEKHLYLEKQKVIFDSRIGEKSRFLFTCGVR